MADYHMMKFSFDEETKAPHVLYFKKNISKGDNDERTIFIANVPPYSTEDGLRNLFKQFGGIDSVTISEIPSESRKATFSSLRQDKTNTFKMAYVRFSKEESVKELLQTNSFNCPFLSTPENSIDTGLEKWISEYNNNYTDESYLQEMVDKHIQEFDMAQAKEENQQQKESDDEGWTTIPTKKRPAAESNTKVKKINKKWERKKKRDKELTNFYMFQQREAKREKIASLRQKFEEDKKRIAQLRQVRKFKPM